MNTMDPRYAKLFEPTNIGRVRLKNRLSMAPMGLVGYSDYMGGFTQNAQNYYIERARGGVGLIITGLCCVDYNEMAPFGLPCPSYNPTLFGMSTIPMNEKIHAYDAKIFIQLTGGLGRSGVPTMVTQHIAPSENENRFDPNVIHRPMTVEEIETLVKDFMKSAAVVQKCGFDGIEIHAVHEGYLLDQFAIAFYNRRTDEYGGDLRGRLKIATDIVKGIKQVCGKDFPVSLRYSVKSFMKGLRRGILPGEREAEVGKDLEEGVEAAKILVEAGYDCLNVDVGTYDSWYWNHPPMYFEDGMYREFGRIVKRAVGVPVILAGRLDDPEIALDALDGCCDIVSYGRPLLTDPYLPEKICTGNMDDVRPCLGCHDGCMGRIASSLPLSCAVNPACGREEVYGLSPAAKPQSVLVVGGGPAGMEAARALAIRGHRVTLVEKSEELGGNLRVGGVPDFKKNDRKLIRWYELQLRKLGVDVQLNRKADEAFVRGLDADKVIVATGGTPIPLDIDDGPAVCFAEDLLRGSATAGDDVVIIGGGLVGCETGLWLAQQGKTITIVEMQDDILGGPHGMPVMNSSMLRELLVFHGAVICTDAKVTAGTQGAVLVSTSKGNLTVPADTVAVSIGYRSDTALYDALSTLGKPVYRIGDCRNVKNIMQAIWDGYEIARGI